MSRQYNIRKCHSLRKGRQRQAPVSGCRLCRRQRVLFTLFRIVPRLADQLVGSFKFLEVRVRVGEFLQFLGRHYLCSSGVISATVINTFFCVELSGHTKPSRLRGLGPSSNYLRKCVAELFERVSGGWPMSNLTATDSLWSRLSSSTSTGT